MSSTGKILEQTDQLPSLWSNLTNPQRRKDFFENEYRHFSSKIQLTYLREQSLRELRFMRGSLEQRKEEAKGNPTLENFYLKAQELLNAEISHREKHTEALKQHASGKRLIDDSDLLRHYIKVNNKDRDNYLSNGSVDRASEQTAINMVKLLEKQSKSFFSFGFAKKCKNELTRLCNSEFLSEMRKQSYSDMNGPNKQIFATIFKNAGTKEKEMILRSQSIEDLRAILKDPHLKGNKQIQSHLERQIQVKNPLDSLAITPKSIDAFVGLLQQLNIKDQHDVLAKKSIVQVEALAESIKQNGSLSSLSSSVGKHLDQRRIDDLTNVKKEQIAQDAQQIIKLLAGSYDASLYRSLGVLRENSSVLSVVIKPTHKGTFQVEKDSVHRMAKQITFEDKSTIAKTAAIEISHVMQAMQTQTGMEYATNLIKLPRFAQERALRSLERSQLSTVQASLNKLETSLLMENHSPKRNDKIVRIDGANQALIAVEREMQQHQTLTKNGPGQKTS